MYRVYEGQEGASVGVTQQEPVAMLTQGHQQKYSTDTEQPSNTWEERVVNVDGGREGGRGPLQTYTSHCCSWSAR